MPLSDSDFKILKQMADGGDQAAKKVLDSFLQAEATKQSPADWYETYLRTKIAVQPSYSNISSYAKGTLDTLKEAGKVGVDNLREASNLMFKPENWYDPLLSPLVAFNAIPQAMSVVAGDATRGLSKLVADIGPKSRAFIGENSEVINDIEAGVGTATSLLGPTGLGVVKYINPAVNRIIAKDMDAARTALADGLASDSAHGVLGEKLLKEVDKVVPPVADVIEGVKKPIVLDADLTAAPMTQEVFKNLMSEADKVKSTLKIEDLNTLEQYRSDAGLATNTARLIIKNHPTPEVEAIAQASGRTPAELANDLAFRMKTAGQDFQVMSEFDRSLKELPGGDKLGKTYLQEFEDLQKTNIWHTLGDWWKISATAAPWTAARNFLSTGIYMPLKMTDDLIASGIKVMLSKEGGHIDQKIGALGLNFMGGVKSLLTGVKSDTNKIFDTILENPKFHKFAQSFDPSGRWSPAETLLSHRDSPVAKILTWFNITQERVASNTAVAVFLRDLSMKKGVPYSDILSHATTSELKMASDWANEIRMAAPPTSKLWKGTIDFINNTPLVFFTPFARFMGQATRIGLEYSPLSIARAFKPDAIIKMIADNDASLFADRMSKGVLGSMMFDFAYGVVSSGKHTGSNPTSFIVKTNPDGSNVEMDIAAFSPMIAPSFMQATIIAHPERIHSAGDLIEMLTGFSTKSKRGAGNLIDIVRAQGQDSLLETSASMIGKIMSTYLTPLDMVTNSEKILRSMSLSPNTTPIPMRQKGTRGDSITERLLDPIASKIPILAERLLPDVSRPDSSVNTLYIAQAKNPLFDKEEIPVDVTDWSKWIGLSVNLSSPLERELYSIGFDKRQLYPAVKGDAVKGVLNRLTSLQLEAIYPILVNSEQYQLRTPKEKQVQWQAIVSYAHEESQMALLLDPIVYRQLLALKFFDRTHPVVQQLLTQIESVQKQLGISEGLSKRELHEAHKQAVEKLFPSEGVLKDLEQGLTFGDQLIKKLSNNTRIGTH